MKAQVDMSTLFGFLIVFLLFIYGLSPVIFTAVANITGNPNADAATKFVAPFFAFFFMVALIIGIFKYAFGRGEEVRHF